MISRGGKGKIEGKGKEGSGKLNSLVGINTQNQGAGKDKRTRLDVKHEYNQQ